MTDEKWLSLDRWCVLPSGRISAFDAGHIRRNERRKPSAVTNDKSMRTTCEERMHASTKQSVRFQSALTRVTMERALAVLFLVTLFLETFGGANIEDVTGVYKPIDGQLRPTCPVQLSIGDVDPNKTAEVATDRGRCDSAQIRFEEVSRRETRGDNVTRHLVRNDGEVVGTIVTGAFETAIECDGGDRRDELGVQKVLTILRPFQPFREKPWDASFKKGQYYIVMQRGAGDTRQICVYRRTRSEIPPTPPPASQDPLVGPQNTGGTGVNMWAWLGPLIAAAVIVIALLVAYFIRNRQEQWYPFQSSAHEDVSEAEFFGRLSQQGVKTARAGDRGPSGVVFTDAIDRTLAGEPESERESSGEHNIKDQFP